MYLDSDDALTPGALRHLHDLALRMPPDVGSIGAYYRDESGKTFPQPAPPRGPFGYVEYLKWLNPPVRSDYLHVFRREVMAEFPWPNDSRVPGQYKLGIIKKWRMCISPRVCATVYGDAPNRWTGGSKPADAQRAQRRVRDVLKARHEILAEFGPDIRRHAPRWHALILRSIGGSYFTIGRRLEGARYLLRYLRRRPWSLRGWGTLTLGLIGPGAFLRGKKLWGK